MKQLLFTLLLALVQAASAQTLRLQGPETLPAGQAFSLQLWLDEPFAGRAADEELLFFGLSLQSSGLRFVGFEPAAGWQDDSPWLGEQRIGASRFPGLPNQGQASEALGWLHFEALGPGALGLSLSSGAADPNLGLGYWQGGSLAAQVQWQGAALPVPGSLALVLVAGLAAVGRWQRRLG
ncbi:hypothetical protein [Inhella sp.]|uniref:hypothetical protein n=1 Tax=Inhella sp. TaxID=1921806 RepID=UPI0035B401E9